MHDTDMSHHTADMSRRSYQHDTVHDEPVLPRSLTREGASQRQSFLNGLNNAIRDNPLPATLIGMGFLWMLMGGKKMTLADALSPQSARSVLGSVAEHAGSAGQTVKDAAGSAVSKISSTVSDAAESLVETASSVGHSLMPAAANTPAIGREIDRYSGTRSRSWISGQQGLQHSLMEAFEERPILLGAAGLVLGAGIAASLPPTATERQVMGKASTYVRDKASELSGQVKEMASAAVDEAKAQGLRPSGRDNTPLS